MIGEVSLHDNRAQLGRAAGGTLLMASLIAVFTAAGPRHWYLFAVSAFFGLVGAILAAFAIRYPRRLTLSRAGLIYRTRSATEEIPAAAILALGVTMVGKLHFITLWYDPAAVPELPAELANYARHQAPYGVGVLYLAPVGPPLKEEQIRTIYRFVQQESLGEWRDYPADVGSDG
jgi:ABC-type proline/glycine betaine transport system permease subunit